ncbi:MAG: iron ABC transporter permease [Bacteroidales bacterium]|nr:iron ABC transporter permease [Bacteroidales bacterium]
MRNRKIFNIIIITLLAGLFLVFISSMFTGSVKIPFKEIFRILTGGEAGKYSWGIIILQSRLPQAITAMFAGAALAVSGLMLQTIFKNPLAGPSILGIEAGASLGVALVMLFLGGTIGGSMINVTLTGYMAIVTGAIIGAALVLGIIIFFSTLVRSNIMLLIIGIMLSYITSSIISLLNYFASAEGVFSYTIWGMGNFTNVSMTQIPLFCGLISIGLGISVILVKPLNALLLGDFYAKNLGVKVSRVRCLLLVSTGILTAVTTAFCGPVSFIGLAVPHIARLIIGSSNHKILLPVTILTGSFMALICNLISTMHTKAGMIPLNAITPIFGVPVILYVIISQKKFQN